ncbi:P-loop containing nucleoside triphosphate hydrolase protein [Epithele typhae]|uniref:P-loop containing nucleoside triphosphate hydrolase protein n=1 Tax=Epithele typhae TaxID=378194 RepID=UPI002008DFF1|nr:P-loop containing nucleoside triphosphate hydrolase protein [Epithele typhae]KAH9915934.1 P-loop containing nucleoside triphosphate hydrolase protein [Epithele typhae]
MPPLSTRSSSPEIHSIFSASPVDERGPSPPTAPPPIADTGYAKTTRELLELVATLRSLPGSQISGLDKVLPRVLVVGGQSSGKSSLVEGTCEINVPRDAGTCTRCPMEFRLSRSPNGAPWSCQVRIRWEFDEHGHRLEVPHEEAFGSRVEDKRVVEALLRAAQEAVLNPSVPVSHFVGLAGELQSPSPPPQSQRGARSASKGSAYMGKSLPFSRNVICVEVSGPDLADLWFVDLPGIVQNADPEIIKLVEDLVMSYISGAGLILLTLPMSGKLPSTHDLCYQTNCALPDDIENQKAASLVKSVDPQGLRTIGVLTKPDTLLQGASRSREMWLDVLEGRRHPLRHGYFCTLQPDDDSRLAGITPAQAREREAEFFRKTTPWAQCASKERLGTRSLVKSVSELLTTIIRDSLPHFMEEVSEEHGKTLRSLSTLPPRAVAINPSTFVLQIITKFCGEVMRHVDGDSAHARLVQSNNAAYLTYKNGIRGTAPILVPFEDGKMPHGARLEEFLAVEDERETTDGVLGEQHQVLYVNSVHDIIEKCRTRGLPDDIPWEVVPDMIRGYQETWEHLTQACFGHVYEAFKETLLNVTHESLKEYRHLKAVVGPIIMDMLETYSRAAVSQFRMILATERRNTFTQNTQYYRSLRSKYLQQYREARRPEMSSDLDDIIKNTVGTLVGHGLGPSVEVLMDRLFFSPKFDESASDEFDAELLIMAKVRAYFQISYKRVIDHIPLSIDYHFLRAFAESLQGVLFERLGLGAFNADARCESYIAEEPGLVAQRAMLATRKERLESVQNALFNFGL